MPSTSASCAAAAAAAVQETPGAPEVQGQPGQGLQDAVVQVARKAHPLLGNGRLMQALLQVELVEVGGDLARDDAAQHQVVGRQRGLVEHQQPCGEALPLQAQAEKAPAAEPLLPAGRESGARPALDAPRAAVQHRGPGAAGVLA
jgi:hypothetical protein